MRSLGLTMSYLRRGLRAVVQFNVAAAAVGLATAYAWNPRASTEDLVLVVTVPVTLAYIGGRLLGGLQLNRTELAEQPQIPIPPSQPTPLTTEELARWRKRLTFWVPYGLVPALLLAFCSIGFVVALPAYALLDLWWAISYGALMAPLLFISGVGLFFLALTRILPSPIWTLAPRLLWRSIKRTARPAFSGLLSVFAAR